MSITWENPATAHHMEQVRTAPDSHTAAAHLRSARAAGTPADQQQIDLIARAARLASEILTTVREQQ
jgi:hypothetical protein